MTLKREVLDLLEDAPNGLCDGCLQDALNVKWRPHVNVTCRNLEREGRLVREKSRTSECERCLKISVFTNRLVPTSTRTATTPSSAIASSRVFGVNQLDDLRRELIQFLNKLEPSSCRDGFSKRVNALRGNQVLPATIASLMLTHASYRNELYYNAYQLSTEEIKILEQIDKYLRGYVSTH